MKNIIKSIIFPRLDSSLPKHELSQSDIESLHALFQSLTNDHSFPYNTFATWVQSKVKQHPGYETEFKIAIQLIEPQGKRAFSTLSNEEQEQILNKLLRRYQSKENNPLWRKITKFTYDIQDLLLSSPKIKRFRTFVVREMLQFYFSTPSGWLTVGYNEYPGKILLDDEKGEVVAISPIYPIPNLVLSDESVEPLDTSRLERVNGSILSVKTKGGKQHSVFTKEAEKDLLAYLQEEKK